MLRFCKIRALYRINKSIVPNCILPYEDNAMIRITHTSENEAYTRTHTYNYLLYTLQNLAAALKLLEASYQLSSFQIANIPFPRLWVEFCFARIKISSPCSLTSRYIYVSQSFQTFLLLPPSIYLCQSFQTFLLFPPSHFFISIQSNGYHFLFLAHY